MSLQTPTSQASRAFILAYGDALIQWANLEFLLGLWFRRIALLPSNEPALAIFYSARSFQGKSEMFTAALDHLDAPSEHLSFLRDAILKAIKYNSVRNQLAHGFVHGSDDGATIAPGRALWKPGEITIAEIRNASANFAKLRRLLEDALDGLGTDPKHVGRPLAECHERLRQLPNAASSDEPSRKQKGRLRQLRSALRNSRAKQKRQ